MHSGLAPPEAGIVKGGQIVMHQTGAMDQLQRDSGTFSKVGAVIAAGQRNRQTNRGPDARAAGGNCIIQCCCQPPGNFIRVARSALRARNCGGHRPVYPSAKFHLVPLARLAVKFFLHHSVS